MLNLYKTLGIRPDAAPADIQAAIKKAAQTQSQPLELLQKAKQCLLNEQTRKQYNTKLFAAHAELLDVVADDDFWETLAKNYCQYLHETEDNFSYDAIKATLSQKLQELGILEEQATNFSRKNYNKMAGRVSRISQAKLGITHYRWRGTLDKHTRDEHLQREGRIFAWDNPPPDGHPGYADGCRCHAEPIFPELADLDAALFGAGGDNRHYHAEMTRRGLKPETGMPDLADDPHTSYGYLPRGATKLPENMQKPIYASIEEANNIFKQNIRNLQYTTLLNTIKKILFNK